MVWRVIDDTEMDIFRHLSTEEALARENAASETKVNTVRFWRSTSAVVMGRFQCTHLEANLKYCTEHNIPIARRFTGGGAVYHDEGNLNITLCLNQSETYVARTLGELYWNFFGAIANGLQSIGIPIRYDPNRQCLRIEGKKVTGTAGWIKHGVSFLHGTLLIDADLHILSQCLSVPPNQPVYRRDKSRIRCKSSSKDVVTTISREMRDRPSNNEIRQAILTGITKLTGEVPEKGNLTEKEMDAAQSLYQTRYRLSEWNLGIPVHEEDYS